MNDAFTLHAIFPNYYSEEWVAYTMRSVLEGIAGDGVEPVACVIAKAKNVRFRTVRPLMPRLVYRYAGRFVRDPYRAIVRANLWRMRPGDVVYSWLTGPQDVTRVLQARGLFVAREMINCTMARRRREMREAYRRLGMDDRSHISDEAIERERQDLLAVDAVFCPNDFVLESVLDCGVAPERCIKTSYGWDPERLAGEGRLLPPSEGLNVLFVGTGDVRKGLPWLLEAWAEAGVKGRLLLAGHVQPEVIEHCGPLLRRSDVLQLGYVDDVGAAYRSADAFCFPTWEEGGPLVTLEAMACGLPCIVTPMGTSGAITEANGGGLIVPPGDSATLAAALRRLANDADFRGTLGRRGVEIAQDYVWPLVGGKRRDALRALRCGRRIAR